MEYRDIKLFEAAMHDREAAECRAQCSSSKHLKRKRLLLLFVEHEQTIADRCRQRAAADI